MQIIEQLLRQGYSLIPVERGSKKPIAGKRWGYRRYKKATREEIFDWYLEFGEINLGIVTGRISDLATIDVDDKGQIPKLLKIIPDLFETFYVLTPRGYHFHYSLNGKHIESTKRLFGLEGVELRTNGLMVLAPGSRVNGYSYKLGRAVSKVKKLPGTITYQRPVIKQDGKTVYLKELDSKLPKFKGESKCIGQILSYDIPEGKRKLSYHIAYTKLLQAKNNARYAKDLIKRSNSKLTLPLTDKEVSDFKVKEVYYYSCSRINELGYINCAECKVRGGLRKVEKLSDRNYQGVLKLTSSERSIAFLLDSYWFKDRPTVNEIVKKTGMNFYAVRDALEALKKKGYLDNGK